MLFGAGVGQDWTDSTTLPIIRIRIPFTGTVIGISSELPVPFAPYSYLLVARTALADVVEMLDSGQHAVAGPLYIIHTGQHVLLTYRVLV